MELITIFIENNEIPAELNDSETALTIAEALPLEGMASVWGEEIYFDIPVQIGEAPDAKEEVEVGDMGYWPTGSAFCIFFGPTPVSTNEEPKAYSPVNIFGRITGDLSRLRTVPDGSKIRVEKR